VEVQENLLMGKYLKSRNEFDLSFVIHLSLRTFSLLEHTIEESTHHHALKLETAICSIDKSWFSALPLLSE
jgi:hypothetical protein